MSTHSRNFNQAGTCYTEKSVEKKTKGEEMGKTLKQMLRTTLEDTTPHASTANVAQNYWACAYKPTHRHW